MMSSIRKQLKSTSFKIVLWITGFSLLGGGTLIMFIKNSIFKKPLTDIAFVNNLAISNMEFYRTYYLFEKIRSIAPQLMPNLNKENIINFVLENFLIPSKILQSKAEKSGINIGTSYICDKLKKNDPHLENLISRLLQQNVYKNGSVDSKALSQALKNQNMTIEEFESILKEGLETNLFQNLIVNSVYIPSYMIKEKYIQDYSKRKFNILNINLDNYLKKVETEPLNQETIENYFNNNKENYRIPEQRSVILWSFDPDNYNIEITNQELEDYYKNKENKDNKTFQELKPTLEKEVKLNKFKQEFKLDAKKVLLESDNSALFNEFVKNKHGIRSEIDNITNEKNNINYNILSEKLFTLLKIGDKSFYENENKGYIIELKSIVKSYIPNLEDIKNKVTKDIQIQKSKELLNLELDKLIHTDQALEQIAKEIKDSKLEKTDWINFKDNKNSLFTKIPKNILKNLINPKQKTKYIDHSGYLIELSEIEPFNQEDFETNKKIIENYLIQEQEENIIKSLQIKWRNEAKIILNENLISNKRK